MTSRPTYASLPMFFEPAHGELGKVCDAIRDDDTALHEAAGASRR